VDGVPADAAPGQSAAPETPVDLPYANVTAVSLSGSPGSYTFAVSVESSDIDCSQFADFWEVITPEGELLYRRILEHSHTDENGTTDEGAPGNTFTRTGGPVNVQAADEVLVRAHLNTTGYNGVVMRGSAQEGFEAALDLAKDFARELQDEPPQPEACLF
jgi:hypothetical protein